MKTPILITIFIFCPFLVISQYKMHGALADFYAARGIGSERLLHRISLGIGRHIVTGTTTLNYKGPDTNWNQIDTTIKKRIKSKHSYAIHAGTFLPLALFGNQSMIVFNMEVYGSYTSLNYDTVYFHPKLKYRNPRSLITMGVPLSIDFKNGGEVSLSKKQSSLLTVGGGVMIGVYGEHVSKMNPFYELHTIPFIKAELGFFAGLAFKFRGTAYLGRVEYFNDATTYRDNTIHMLTNTNYGFNLSLLVMPFSFDWRTEEWY